MLLQALVDQSYTLSTQPLGRGSSGDVYPATHRGSGRHVACKLIRRDAAMNDMKTMINEVGSRRVLARAAAGCGPDASVLCASCVG